MSARIRRGAAVFTDLLERDEFSLATSYNEMFVNRLKEMIDPLYRHWDAVQQVWVIDYDFFLPLMRLVAEYFGEIVVRDPSDKYVYRTTIPLEEPE